MFTNAIRLSLGSVLFLFIAACVNKPVPDRNTLDKKKVVDTCRYYRYEAGQVISTLGCRNCHLEPYMELKDDRGWPTFRGLANMDSLKLIDYVFTKKHKGWYSKTGSFKAARMDTLNDFEIKSAVRYIKDAGRNIPIPGP